ncbi:basic salivary proline-rich protein 3 [Drosophila elegans]|uniref:basic salivary proline-rich protein 3 n=1 Tax=Drosophila elegans TaxID=30023 RepID=UPI0007E5FB77|nr:basic salivary proline-rich protein 3 [Drosophila elegans]
MTRSSSAWSPVWLWALMALPATCLAQFAYSSAGGAVASAGGVTVVAQLPGLGAINGLINAMHNNNNRRQQQQFERLQQGRPGMGPNRRGPGFGPPNRQQAPPGWPPGWQWGNQNQPGFGWDQQGYGPDWNGGGGGQRPGWNGGGGMGPPPPRPGWNGGGGMGPRPGWNGGGGRGPPPPRPGWNGERPPPPPRPDWNGPGWNGGMRPSTEWDENQQQPFPDQPEPNVSTPRTPAIPMPDVQSTTPRTAETQPTIQPRPPPTQPTKDTLIVGTNRPPLVPHQNPDTPTYPTWPTPQPLPNPLDKLPEQDAIIFPSSSRYVHLPNQDVPSQPIDVRRR